jgi:hypothetical protein
LSSYITSYTWWRKRESRRRKREVDLMAVGAVAAVPVLAPNLLHVKERGMDREKDRRRKR